MSRKPSCKTCVSYQPQADGSFVCNLKRVTIEKSARSSIENDTCYERRQKKKLTPQELSLVRSNAGRKGGRVSGYGGGRAPTKTMTIRQLDYEVITAYAKKLNYSIAETIHKISKSITIKYPDTKPKGWIEK